MALFGALTNAKFVLAGTDLSSKCVEFKVNRSRADLKTTAMSSSGAETRQGGLFDGSITVTLLQDYNSGQTNDVIKTAFESATGIATFSGNPTNSANSATNPNTSGSVLVNSNDPLAGKVGDLLTVTHTWPISGAVSTTTA